MKICTWNSQGNPLNDAIKLNILNHLLTIEQCNVVMIQECGQFILPARGCVKTQFYGLKAQKAHRRVCQNSLILKKITKP